MFIKEANKIHEEGRYDYSLSNYKNGTTPIIIICNICNNKFKQIPKNHIKGAKCTFCNESNGEKAIEEYFLKENINYKKQYFFNDCRNKNPLRFDFYLPDYNLCIEFDGRQHNQSVDKFGGEKELLNNIFKDNIKNKYCDGSKNKPSLIRISYTQFNEIESILKKYLFS